MADFIARRELLKLASATFAALAAKPGLAMPADLVASVKAADWKPAFFNEHQNRTVMALTELIIPRTDTPGANDAKVYRYLDLFFSAGNLTDGPKFLEGLRWLDEAAQQVHGRDFMDCSEAEQTALLADWADDGKKDIPSENHAFFRRVKDLTSDIYFSTPEGYRELNKFGPPPATVGCTHGGDHASA